MNRLPRMGGQSANSGHLNAGCEYPLWTDGQVMDGWMRSGQWRETGRVAARPVPGESGLPERLCQHWGCNPATPTCPQAGLGRGEASGALTSGTKSKRKPLTNQDK